MVSNLQFVCFLHDPMVGLEYVAFLLHKNDQSVTQYTVIIKHAR